MYYSTEIVWDILWNILCNNQLNIFNATNFYVRTNQLKTEKKNMETIIRHIN